VSRASNSPPRPGAGALRSGPLPVPYSTEYSARSPAPKAIAAARRAHDEFVRGQENSPYLEALRHSKLANDLRSELMQLVEAEKPRKLVVNFVVSIGV